MDWHEWLDVITRRLSPPVITAIVVFLFVGKTAHKNEGWGLLVWGWLANILYLYAETFEHVSTIFGLNVAHVSATSSSNITAMFFLTYFLDQAPSTRWRYPVSRWTGFLLGAAVIAWVAVATRVTTGTFFPESIDDTPGLTARLLILVPQVLFEFVAIGGAAFTLRKFFADRGLRIGSLVVIPWAGYALLQFAYFTIVLENKAYSTLAFAVALLLKIGIAVGLFLVFLEQNERGLLARLQQWQQNAFAWFAHELKNPAYAIRMLSVTIVNLIATRDYGQVRKEAIKLMDLTRILSSVVESVKIASERLNPDLLRFMSLNSCVEKSLNEVKVLYGIRPQDVTSTYSKNLVVCAVEPSLRQAFANLVRNAVEAAERSEDGAPMFQLKLETRRDSEGGREFAVTRIEDSGPGIEQEQQRLIFEAYYSTKEGINRGLGLWVVRNFVEMFGGHIHLQSPVHGRTTGTAFEVWLPRVPEEGLDADPRELWRKAIDARNRRVRG